MLVSSSVIRAVVLLPYLVNLPSHSSVHRNQIFLLGCGGGIIFYSDMFIDLLHQGLHGCGLVHRKRVSQTMFDWETFLVLCDHQIGGVIEDLIVSFPILGIACLQRTSRFHLDAQEVFNLLQCSSVGLESRDKDLD